MKLVRIIANTFPKAHISVKIKRRTFLWYKKDNHGVMNWKFPASLSDVIMTMSWQKSNLFERPLLIKLFVCIVLLQIIIFFIIVDNYKANVNEELPKIEIMKSFYNIKNSPCILDYYLSFYCYSNFIAISVNSYSLLLYTY